MKEEDYGINQSCEEISEDVERSIREMNSRHNERKSSSAFLRVFSKAVKPLKRVGKKLKTAVSSLTMRTTAIYFLLTLLAVLVLSLVFVSIVEEYVKSLDAENSEAFLLTLKIVVFGVDLAMLAIVTFMGYLSTRFTLAPLRSMIKKIKTVTAENLSNRIDEESSATELKALAQEINGLLEDMDNVYTRQKKFISDASHELKTPIAVIAGYTNLLQRWGKEDKAVLEESLDSIAREVENMKTLVERLLFLARIGQYLIKKSDVDIGLLLDEVREGYVMAGIKRVLTVRSESVVIHTDVNLLTECLRALIDNAIKYSDEGSVISLTAQKKAGGVKIEVKDNGVGIAEENLTKIFDRFYRCDSVRNRGDNSCGLGLTICKSIVETLGGKIYVESVQNIGTTFTVEIGGENENSSTL